MGDFGEWVHLTLAQNNLPEWPFPDLPECHYLTCVNGST
jgi:hypothetical protein